MIDTLKDYIRSHKALLLILLGYILIRLPLLDHAFLLRGERDIVLSGYSLLKTGTDLYGNFMPLQFFGLDQPSPLLSFYFSALAWIVFPIKNIFFARLPFMLAAACNIVLVYELIKFITKNKKVSLITAAILGFSPGYFHLSMLALEINLAMPLLLLGMLLYVKKKKLWGWVFLALSFFTYNGFRPLIPFLLVYLEFFEYVQKGNFSRFIKQSFIAGVLFIIFFGITYFFIDGDIMTSRSSDLVFLSYEKINPLVDLRRNTAGGPLILKQILNNKVTNTLYYMTEVTFEGISLNYLFFRGDRAAIYTSTFAGQFFSVFLPFYFLGFIALGRKLQKNYFYILGFIPVALVPSIVNIDYVSVAIRSLLASVSYAFIMALGVQFTYDQLKKAKPFMKFTIYAVILIIAVVELSYFSYNYVFRRPTMMFESYFEHERNIAERIIASDEKVTVYDDSPKNLITAYQMLEPQSDIRELQRLVQGDGKVYETNAFIMHVCPQHGNKEQMYVEGTIIAESCLSFEEYQVIDSQPQHERIQFEDISNRNSFFIYHDESAVE